jgi:exodeoxyribonuclease-1
MASADADSTGASLPDTFYWHDYETWGNTPAVDRPCQFAGLRTDAELNEVGEPLVIFARPADDLLPQPDACMVTGISPQRAAREGLPEAEFARAIQQELAAPGTCGVGYNSLRFDDEVTRYLFYRNLLPPYAHAHRNGNSRWDLIDALRLAHALRPDGIQWPEREVGITSFRLEDLTAANGIDHAGAHDALADVRATVAMARLLKQAQPRLFAYALTMRRRQTVDDLLARGQPLLHVSARYPAAQGCIAPVAVLATAADNPKQHWVFDLRGDPAVLLDLSAEDIRARLFVATEDLPEGVERIPLKGVKTNHVPMLAPMGTLGAEAAARWRIDPARVTAHAAFLGDHAAEIAAKVREVHQREPDSGPRDPERMLYGGAFFQDNDIRTMARLHELTPQALAAEHPRFDDPRLPTLLFRMRARSWPETLTEAEREDWDAWRFERLTDPDAGASITIDAFDVRLEELRAGAADDQERTRLLDDLAAWGEEVMDAAG